MERIAHWTIKVTWEDSSKLTSGSNKKPYTREEYLEYIPDWVASNVDSYLDGLEQEHNEEEE
jgi:hypothetical protein|tara:strand:+ start:278 stop:463 length:186 start_codon:yes stop_codon:yes gene_type:complete